MKKIVKTIVSRVCWAVVLLYVCTAALLHVPAIQRMTGSSVASVLSDKLGTKVSVGRVDLGFLNRVIIDDIRILDRQQQPMLCATRLSAKLDVLPLLRGQVRVSSAQLFGLQADLYQQREGQPANFQFVLDALKSTDNKKKTPLDLSIGSLIIRNGSVRWNQHYRPFTPSRFNVAHLDISHLSAHVMLQTLTDDSLDARVKKFAFRESSGLDLRGLRLRVAGNRSGLTVSDLDLQLPQTHLQLPVVKTAYRLNNGKLDLSSLSYTVEVDNSTLAPSDFAFLSSALKGVDERLTLTAKATGTADRLTLSHCVLGSRNISFGLNMSGSVTQLRSTPAWTVRFNHLTVSSKGFQVLTQILKDQRVSLPPVIGRLEHLTFHGSAHGQGSNMALKGQLSTGVGSLSTVSSLTNGRFDVRVKTDGVQLDRLLDNTQLGMVVADLHVSGAVPKGNNLDLMAQGTVDRVDFRQYSYRNIRVDATYRGDTFNGLLAMDDPNGRFSLNGTVAHLREFLSHGRQPLEVNAMTDVAHVNLHRLHLTDALGDRTIGFQGKANLQLTSLSDLAGVLSLNGLSVTGEGDHYYIDHLQASSTSGSLQRTTRLEGEMGEVELRGQYDYASLPAAVANVLRSKMPSLVGGRRTLVAQPTRCSVSAELRDVSLLSRLLHVPLQLHQPLYVDATIDDRSNAIDGTVYASSLAYDGTRVDNLLVLLETQGDSLYLKTHGDRIDRNGNPFSVHLQSLAANDEMSTYTEWNAHGRKALRGTLNTRAAFFRERGHLGVRAEVLPSEAQFDTIRLAVQPSSLTYVNRTLSIDRFEVSNGRQHVIVNGQTTGQPTDSLTVDLQDINVAYVLDLVNFHSVDFSGSASGTASIKSLFQQPSVAANLTVSDFTFENGQMGTLQAKVDFDGSRVDIDAVADDGPEAQTIIGGYVALKDNYIDLPITARGTRLGFLESFCSSFMDNVDAHGYGRVRVFGDLRDVNLEGDLRASGTLDVTPLRTSYEMRNAPVHIIPDHIVFQNDTVYDKYGHIGIVSGQLNHESLRNLSYDIRVDAQNLLAYDHKTYGSNTFYGTVFGTGYCTIRGKSGELVMDVVAVPEKGSFIEYNASYAGDAEEAEFIRWGSRTQDEDEAYVADADVADSLSADNNPDASAKGTQRLRASVPALRPQSSTTATPDIPTDMHINFLVNANQNFTLRVLMDAASGDVIALNGDGVIRATYFNKGAFQMFGNYNVDHGVYKLTIQNIIKKEFQFQPGSTIAFGGDPYAAALNLKGIYTVNGASLSDLQLGSSFTRNNVRVNCLMDIKGTAEQPTVEFGLDLPTLSSDAQQMVRSVINSEEDMNQQVLYLLAVGRFYPQGNNNATQDGQSQSQTSLAMQSLLSGTISQQINTVLNNVVKSNDWNFGANISTGDEGFSNAEYEGLLSGRMFNNRLLFNGQFGYRDNVNTNNGSFIGDFDLRYLLTPTGSFAVRVYNQTNDRYFTRNSLTTQGLGIILKKDFNGLKDLFPWLRRKSKKKDK